MCRGFGKVPNVVVGCVSCHKLKVDIVRYDILIVKEGYYL